MVPLVVDGAVRGVGVLLSGRLAVALCRLHTDEGEVEGTDLLRVLEGGGLERDDLLRQCGDLGRHRSKLGIKSSAAYCLLLRRLRLLPLVAPAIAESPHDKKY